MQKLLNQRRTIYWLATFCCVIFGFFAIIFGALGWGTVSILIGSGSILAACLLGVLAIRT